MSEGRVSSQTVLPVSLGKFLCALFFNILREEPIFKGCETPNQLQIRLSGNVTNLAPRGKGHGWDEQGDWDWHIYTIDTTYKIDN